MQDLRLPGLDSAKSLCLISCLVSSMMSANAAAQIVTTSSFNAQLRHFDRTTVTEVTPGEDVTAAFSGSNLPILNQSLAPEEVDARFDLDQTEGVFDATVGLLNDEFFVTIDVPQLIPADNEIALNANIGEGIRYFTDLRGFGDHSGVADTVVTQQFINDTGGRADLGLTVTIFPGEVSLTNPTQVDANGSAAATSASLQFEILVDGLTFFAGFVDVDSQNGVVLDGQLTQLAGFSETASGVSWEETAIAIDLGEFAANQSREVQFVLRTAVAGNTSCVNSDPDSICTETVVTFNDPCRGCRFLPLSEPFNPNATIVIDASGPGGSAPQGPEGFEFDNIRHPYVGLILFQNPTPPGGDPADAIEMCEGSLVNPTTMVTAGHCTIDALSAQVWFQANGQAISNSGFPVTGGIQILGPDIRTVPTYIEEEFVLDDLGVVFLAEPVLLEQYASIPEVGSLNALRRGQRKGTAFTSIGFGLGETVAQEESLFPLTRMLAKLRLIQINVRGTVGDHAMLLSNNPTGGIFCIGNSGGPHLLADSDVIAGVTSFAKNANCAGSLGVYRLDQAKDRAWLNACVNEFGVGGADGRNNGMCGSALP